MAYKYELQMDLFSIRRFLIGIFWGGGGGRQYYPQITEIGITYWQKPET